MQEHDAMLLDETPEERKRRLKREKMRRYRANVKARQAQGEQEEEIAEGEPREQGAYDTYAPPAWASMAKIALGVVVAIVIWKANKNK